jgi:hypothetical protein
MDLKKWTLAGAMVTIVAAASVWAGAPKLRVLQTSAYTVTVSQTRSGSAPKYNYAAGLAGDLVALALGTNPSSNQVLAIAVNCDSTAASLLVFDKSNSNIITIAQTTAFDTVQQADNATGETNAERFVAVFDVQPVGNLAGGYLTVAGRLHLDTNGCVQAVLKKMDRDPYDAVLGDKDVASLDPAAKQLTERSGQAHLSGVLDVVSNGQTNTVLVPSGHLTFSQQLDEFVN